jgi:hypothetical protein
MAAMLVGKVQNRKVVSLRRYRAHRVFRNFLSLPVSQRTHSRSMAVLEAIFDYAYEYVPEQKWGTSRRLNVSPAETRRISRRLEEFMIPARRRDTDPIIRWLHENMVEEAWENPEELSDFVGEYIKDR